MVFRLTQRYNLECLVNCGEIEQVLLDPKPYQCCLSASRTRETRPSVEQLFPVNPQVRNVYFLPVAPRGGWPSQLAAIIELITSARGFGIDPWTVRHCVKSEPA